MDSTFGLLGDALLFVDTASHHAEVRTKLESAGYTPDHHHTGEELVDEGLEEVMATFRETLHDTTRIHLVHTAATEVEMWAAASRRKLARVVDDETLSVVSGASIHHHDHTLSVIAAAKRLLNSLRTSDEVRVGLGSARASEDMYQRGYTLLNRLLKLADSMLANEADSRDNPLPSLRNNLATWLANSRAMASRAFEDSRSFGYVGYVPDGIGVPLGGTAWTVVRHARAQSDVEIEGPAGPAPGWSVGRQGQNRENVGQGYSTTP